MGIRIPRKKPRHLLLSVIYRLHRLLPIGRRRKFGLYLDLEWIFDRLSMEMSFAHYGQEAHPFRRHALAFLHRHLKAEHAVLDLGCKTGFMSQAIAAKTALVVGVDHDADAIREAQATWQRSNLEFMHIDALLYLKGTQQRFDVLILSHILEHLDEPEAFLRSFKDHFAHIYIELPDFDRYYLNHYRKDLGRPLIYSDDDHVSEFDRDELRAIIDACGMRVVEAEYRFGVQRLWCSTR